MNWKTLKWLGIGCVVLLAIVLIITPSSGYREPAIRGKEEIEVKNIITLLILAKNDEGKIPQRLEDIPKKLLRDDEVLPKLLYIKGTTNPRWKYYPENLNSEDPYAIVLEGMPNKDGGHAVAYANGDAEYIIKAKK